MAAGRIESEAQQSTAAEAGASDPGRGIRRVLGSHGLPLAVTATAVLLTLPSVWLGLIADDHVLEATLRNPPFQEVASRSPVDVFALVSGRSDGVNALVQSGGLPWWTSPKLRQALRREAFPVIVLFAGVDGAGNPLRVE